MSRLNPSAGNRASRREGLIPVTTHMSAPTAVCLVLVAAISCMVLAGCGSDETSSGASKPVKASDGPGYTGHPDLPSMSSLSPTERLNLTVGSEANSTEFQEVADVVHGYLDARAEGDWELACSFISPIGQRLLQGSGEKEGDENTSCPSVLQQHTTGSPAELQKEAHLADVGSVRVGGGASKRGQATYRVANALRVVGVSGVSGEWGITSINPIKIG